MRKVFIVLFLFKGTSSISQRAVIHRDLILTQQSNSAYKLSAHKLYDNKLKQIQNNREKTLAYATTIEEVQRKIYGTLTNVDGALRNGKTLIYIANKIPKIYENLSEATALAAGKPYLMTIAADQGQVIIERVIKLQNYLNDFVLKDDPKALINPTDRARFVHEVYQNIVIIHAMSSSLVRTFKMRNLQDAINKVVPYQMYYNVDRIIAQDIIKKMKF